MTGPGAGLVSVIVPVFNGERYIEECLRSALGQTYRPLEIVVVDDGSTDSSVELASRISGPITIVQQGNAGVYAARNAGARVASGEFLAFLDVDDLWEPAKIEKQVAVFRRHPEVVLVSTLFDEIDAAGHPLARGGKPPRGALDRVTQLYRELLMHGNCVGLSTCMVQRDVFLAYGGFYTKERILSADYDLWIRLAERRPGFVLSETLCHYRVLQTSLLHGSLDKEYGAQLNIVRMHRQRYGAWGYRARLSQLYRDWADSAFYEGADEAWEVWRRALAQNPLNVGAWLLAARVLGTRLWRRVRPVDAQ